MNDSKTKTFETETLTIDDLPADSREALIVYIQAVGPGWQRSLRKDWNRGGTDVWQAKDSWHLIQRLRSTHGSAILSF